MSDPSAPAPPRVVWSGSVAHCLGCGMHLPVEYNDLPTGVIVVDHGAVGEGCPNFGKRFGIALPAMQEVRD